VVGFNEENVHFVGIGKVADVEDGGFKASGV
jgi:hypothetical protein